MALATLSTPWCSFESAAFTRRSNRLMNEFNALERQASLHTMQGMQQATIHTRHVHGIPCRTTRRQRKARQLLRRTIPPDVRKAYDAWIAEKPFENPNADPHPFVPNLYEVRGAVKPPKRPQRLPAACGQPAMPGVFPVSTSRNCSVRHSAFLRQRLGKVRTASSAHRRIRFCHRGFPICRSPDSDASVVKTC